MSHPGMNPPMSQTGFTHKSPGRSTNNRQSRKFARRSTVKVPTPPASLSATPAPARHLWLGSCPLSFVGLLLGPFEESGFAEKKNVWACKQCLAQRQWFCTHEDHWAASSLQCKPAPSRHPSHSSDLCAHLCTQIPPVM